MRGRTERTPKKEQAFLAALAKGLSVSGACDAAKLGRSTVYEWRESDRAFKAAWDDAIDAGADVLEDEARRRAYEGTEEGVYHEGQRVDCSSLTATPY